MIELDRKLLLSAFRDEADELLGELERLALDLDAQPGNRGLVEQMFRCAHTLKGSASCVGFESVIAVAHQLESLFEAVTTKRRAPGRWLSGVSLEALDLLRRGCQVADEEREAPIPGAGDLVERIVALLVDDPERGEAVVWSAGPLGGGGRAARSLRVDVDRLDALLNLAGEVAVAQGRLGALLDPASAAHTALLAFQGLFQTLQESVMRLRVVPLGPSFERFRRAVHELSQRVDKQVVLNVEGGDVEVDVTLAEALRDPLMHMVRNAIDHGIESQERRFAANKLWPGRITLRARYDGNYVVVEVSDDGAGLDQARLLEKARELGVNTPLASNDEALHELLFMPGVSTAKEVTEISGRGIGMDVVRRSIEALRGTIALQSVPGQGLTVSIRIPLSLALIQGFGLQVGEETYIVPLDSVRECLDLERDRTLTSKAGGVIELRGKPLPFVDLAAQLGGARVSKARRSIVVLEHAGRRAGLDVDGLLGEVQTVIKPLGPLFADSKNVAGSAVLHDGSVALVLDVGSLLRTMSA